MGSETRSWEWQSLLFAFRVVAATTFAPADRGLTVERKSYFSTESGEFTPGPSAHKFGSLEPDLRFQGSGLT